MGHEIDIQLEWFRGISKPKKKYDHCRQQNETNLLRDDVIIKLVLVKDIIQINTNQPFTVSYYYRLAWCLAFCWEQFN